MNGPTRPSWTGAVRERAVRALPPEKLLPDSQPAYMASWIYLFGVLSLVSLMLIIASHALVITLYAMFRIVICLQKRRMTMAER